MSNTDNMTTWLLGGGIKDVQQRNIELPANTLRSDQVYEVTLADGKEIILHCEFESGDDTNVMSWRMQEYMHKLTRWFKKEVYSVVIYLKGKGKNDKGVYKIGTVSWQYKVIHLWNTQARGLLNTQNPALATLIGSAKFEKAKEELMEAMDIIVGKADNEVKTELLSILVALTQDERLSKMVETNIESKGFFLDTPFIKRIRGESREEGIEIGAEKRSYEIARNMKQEGMSLERIARLTGLSIEEIKLLQS